MRSPPIDEPLEAQLARAKAAFIAAADAAQVARANRQAAQAEINRIHGEIAAQHAAAERARWADPELVAGIAEAAELLRTATADRDAVHARLLVEYRNRSRADQRTASDAYGKQVGFVVGSWPDAGRIVDQIQEDQRYLVAEQARVDAKVLHLRLVRAEQRGAQLRQYRAGVTDRAARRSPLTAALERLGMRSKVPGADLVETV